jgi:large subunit ribosomal protein L23|uniref:Ribosomal protein L23 n=1 Tax=Thorea hispida TaxID=202687 RepID=A0A1C9CAR5_9FLOR|nr:ribosomal protein L23 [Thorea hispida]AOM65483.1 ribosomal protein L23 [Thorea hispida]ARX95852.1 50S ribosomal protein L23 [Thorea hispida]UNJ79137.1 ribosomal protein L23 [Thorea hispida]
MPRNSTRFFFDIIKKPIITDKTTKLLELNQYSFIVDKKATKNEIKQAIKYIFQVHIIKINTVRLAPQYKHVGKFHGKKAQYKKAIFTLAQNDQINLFPEN